jgi:glycosyltransferase involved in cell wall biosynthesis
MKILVLQEDLPPQALGGAGVVVAALIKEYERLGHTVAAVANLPGYNPRWRAWRCLYNRAGVRAVHKALRESKPDVVHAHNVHQTISYFALAHAWLRGYKVILTAHDVQAFNYGKLVNYKRYKISAWQQFREQRFRYNPLRNAVIRHILHRHISGVVAVSQALKDALQANGIKVQAVIHNGIDAAWWASSEGGEAFKQKHRLGERVVLFSGGSYLKGTKQMLDAFVLVRKTVPDAQLLVVGRNAPQGEGVVSAGWLNHEELRAAYHASAVVAVPSICFDSFPTINLEAMSAGLPVVATTLGGSAEAVIDAQTGYILDPFDTKLLAQRLADLLIDKGKAQSFGEAGRTRVQKEFTLAGQAQKYIELFKQTL